MPEPDVLDTRLEAALHGFADRALTSVDAVAVAERASRARRRGALGWLDASVPMPVPMLVVLALLLMALAWALVGGAPWDRRGLVMPVATASPEPATPTAAPLPSTDGQDDEWLAGTERVGAPAWVEDPGSGAPWPFNGSMSTEAVTNDRRATGTGTWTFTFNRYETTGPAWGPYRMVGADGTWEGTCKGSLTADGAGIRSCWLTGSGGYAGSSYFIQARWPASGIGTVEGVIVPAPPPEP